MYKDYHTKKSRLNRLEEKRSIKQAFFFIFLTIITIVILIFLGIPGLIKMVNFFGDLKSSQQQVETNNSMPPPAPVLQSTFTATSSAKIKISGYSQNNTTIKLFVNDNSVKDTLTDKDGNFVFDNINLTQGQNTLKVKAIDAAQSESQFSNILTITFDNEAPTLEIINPQPDQQFFDKDKEINVEGQTDNEITVYVNSRFTKSDSTGHFKTRIVLNEGDNIITVKAQDQAGNETIKEIKVSYSS